MAAKHPTRWAASGNSTLVCARSAGCESCRPNGDSCDNGLPRELAKTYLPPYTIEPPDILLIDALRIIPVAALPGGAAGRPRDPGVQRLPDGPRSRPVRGRSGRDRELRPPVQGPPGFGGGQDAARGESGHRRP